MGTLLPKDTKSQRHVVQGEKAIEVNNTDRFDQNKVPFFLILICKLVSIFSCSRELRLVLLVMKSESSRFFLLFFFNNGKMN